MTSSCGLRSSTCGTARISMRSSPDTAPKLQCDARVFWRDPVWNASKKLALRWQNAGCLSHRSIMLVTPFSMQKEDCIACTILLLENSKWPANCLRNAGANQLVDARGAHGL